MKTLNERALLVSLNISQWTARKFDKRATEGVVSRAGCVDNAARVNKNLLPDQAALDTVIKKSGEIRGWFLARTLPWAQEGQRLLKSDQYIPFTGDMRAMKSDWWRCVDAFVEAYPELRARAAHSLGNLFNRDDYPDQYDLKSKFNIDVVCMPVPDVSDWRIDVGDEERRRLEEDLQARMDKAAKDAMSSAWQRVYDVVARAHERLADAKNIFRDSLVENAVELCAILPGLNITNDPALEAMRREIEGSLCRYNPDTLRSDPLVREETADKMSELMAKMSGLYGVAAA
jgi:hypothetical protein